MFTSELLEEVAVTFGDPKTTQQIVSYTLISALEGLQGILQEIKDRLDAYSSESQRRVKWPFMQLENERLLSSLERYKQTLTLAVVIANRTKSNHIDSRYEPSQPS